MRTIKWYAHLVGFNIIKCQLSLNWSRDSIWTQWKSQWGFYSGSEQLSLNVYIKLRTKTVKTQKQGGVLALLNITIYLKAIVKHNNIRENDRLVGQRNKKQHQKWSTHLWTFSL